MAEIKIVRKKERSGSFWPWMVGLLAVLLVAAWLVFEFSDDRDRELSESEIVTEPYPESAPDTDDNLYSSEYGDALNHYEKEYNRFESEMDQEQDNTPEAIRALAEATISLVRERDLENVTEIQQASEVLRQKANEMDDDQDLQSSEDAGLVQQAALATADVLKEVQQEAFPNLDQEVDKVRTAAHRIDPDVAILNQKEAIKDFFQISLAALRDMGGNTRTRS